MSLLPAPTPWPRRAVVAAIVVAGAVLGLGLLLFSLWTYLEPAATDSPVLPDEWIAVLVLTHLVLGIAGIALTPFALRHSPVEADPLSTESGPVSALVCGALTIVCGVISPLATPLAVVALVSMCSRRSVWWPVTAVLTYVIGAAIGELTGIDGYPGFDWELFALALVFPVIALLIGLFRRRQRDARQRILAQARMAEAEANAREDRARISERTRIARDMHDTLSHRLSLIAMHAGALEYRAETDPDDVRTSAATIRESAHAAAEDLRTVLTVLREVQEDTAPRLDLEELAAQARQAGTPVAIRWEAPLTPADYSRAPTIIAHTMYRVVQECLTNARKHAPGAPVQVTLTPTKRTVVLRVSNPVVGGAGSGVGDGVAVGSFGEAGRDGLVVGSDGVVGSSFGEAGRDGVVDSSFGEAGRDGVVGSSFGEADSTRADVTGSDVTGSGSPGTGPTVGLSQESGGVAGTTLRRKSHPPAPGIRADSTAAATRAGGTPAGAGGDSGSALPGSGLGHIGLAERVRLVGGTMEVHDPRIAGASGAAGTSKGDGRSRWVPASGTVPPSGAASASGTDDREFSVTVVLPWQTGGRRA